MTNLPAVAGFTVLGSTGLVGGALVRHLHSLGHDVFCPARSLSDFFGRVHGNVVFCIGNDRFRDDPHGVTDAEVDVLNRILRNAEFESFTYLSSTRMYYKHPDTSEDQPITLHWDDPARLFIAAKLTGESLCIAKNSPKIHVVRLSNVVGLTPHTHAFLGSIIRDALLKGVIRLSVTPKSSKDYIWADDVAPILTRIALGGRSFRYNLACGTNVSAGEIADVLTQTTGCRVDWQPGAVEQSFPPINTVRIGDEFAFTPQPLVEHLPALIEQYRAALT